MIDLKTQTFIKKMIDYGLKVVPVSSGWDVVTHKGVFVAFVGNLTPYSLTVSTNHYDVSRELYNDLVRFARTAIEKR